LLEKNRESLESQTERSKQDQKTIKSLQQEIKALNKETNDLKTLTEQSKAALNDLKLKTDNTNTAEQKDLIEKNFNLEKKFIQTESEKLMLEKLNQQLENAAKELRDSSQAAQVEVARCKERISILEQLLSTEKNSKGQEATLQTSDVKKIELENYRLKAQLDVYRENFANARTNLDISKQSGILSNESINNGISLPSINVEVI
jgi:chromosome segregation ATPase